MRNTRNRMMSSSLLTGMGFATFLLISAPALAVTATAPPPSTWQQFGALSLAGLTGQAGSGAKINGSVGSSTAISNFPPSTVLSGFVVFPVADPIVGQALIDANGAWVGLALQGIGTVLPDNLATVGGPLTAGVYSTTTGAANLPTTAVLTLNGPGIFVFNVASLTADVLSSVDGTASPCNVFWHVNSSATLNGNNFRGTVLAGSSVTVGDIVGPSLGTNLEGSAVGLTASVSMAGDGGATIGGCSSAGVPPPAAAGIPTLSGWGLMTLTVLIALVGLASIYRLRRV